MTLKVRDYRTQVVSAVEAVYDSFNDEFAHGASFSEVWNRAHTEAVRTVFPLINAPARAQMKGLVLTKEDEKGRQWQTNEKEYIFLLDTDAEPTALLSFFRFGYMYDEVSDPIYLFRPAPFWEVITLTDDSRKAVVRSNLDRQRDFVYFLATEVQQAAWREVESKGFNALCQRFNQTGSNPGLEEVRSDIVA